MGCTSRASSSSKPFASSHRTVVALPDIPMSPSVPSLTACTLAATSSERTVVFCQVGSLGVVDRTYVGIVLMNSAAPRNAVNLSGT